MTVSRIYRRSLGATGATFWVRVAQTVFIALTLIVVLPSLVSRFTHFGGHSLETRSHVLPGGQNPLMYPSQYGCHDPYLEPGYLTTNNFSHAENYWTPFSDECPRAPHFLQDVIERKPLPWLKGRTLLMIGDSVDRNNLNFFCQLVNSSKYPVTLRVSTMTNLSAVHISDSAKDPTNKDPGDLTLPRVCRVEEYDFEIINFFHYGMHDDEMWKEKKVYTPPGVIEKRIPLVKPLMDEYGRNPDMILLASGLWDLAGWTKKDAYAWAPNKPSIKGEVLNHWLERAEYFVDMVDGMFPDTFLAWRWLHYCLVDWGWWFLAEGPPGVEFDNTTPRAPFHEVRVFQMNQAYQRLQMKKPQLHRFSWGELLTGHMDEGIDSIHPAKNVGGVIWSDMILYYMSRLKKGPRH